MAVVSKFSGTASGQAAYVTTTQSGIGDVTTTKQVETFTLVNSDNDSLNVTFELVRSGEHHDVIVSGNNDISVTLEVA